jgi:hypothetical protein
MKKSCTKNAEPRTGNEAWTPCPHTLHNQSQILCQQLHVKKSWRALLDCKFLKVALLAGSFATVAVTADHATVATLQPLAVSNTGSSCALPAT